jgi:FMN-dependent oxidoreductase (nitrilotriacetate monooxygenase family)
MKEPAMAPERQLKLGAFAQASGHHVAAWRHPHAPARAAVDFEHHRRMAELAERAKFDLFFLADIASVWESSPEAMSRTARSDRLEPVTLLAALAVVTRRIGLVATATTSYNEPYHVARKFATIDHLSGGRAGWNLVTSNNEAEALNYGREAHFEHGERYERAAEFADLVTALWDGWGDNAFPRDKTTGIYIDPDRLHHIDHRGRHFSVRGPLNIEPPPQGRPVIVQAGSSEAGRELAARTGEVSSPHNRASPMRGPSTPT